MDLPNTLIKQIQREHAYANADNKQVLVSTIEANLDTLFLSYTLKLYYKLDRYLQVTYHERKNKRVAELNTFCNSTHNPYDFIISRIIASVLSSPLEITIQQAVGYLASFMPNKRLISRIRLATDLLVLGQTKLYSIKAKPNTKFYYIDIPQCNKTYLNTKLHGELEWVNTTHFNAPLTIKPVSVIDNYNAGYYSVRVPLLLGNLSFHTETQNYATINTLNSIEWVLDPDVLKESELGSVMHNKVPHMPAVNNYKLCIKQSNKLYKEIGSDPFWLVWQYDSRGRIYSHGYHINFQSYEFKKGLLNFNEYVYLT